MAVHIIGKRMTPQSAFTSFRCSHALYARGIPADSEGDKRSATGLKRPPYKIRIFLEDPALLVSEEGAGRLHLCRAQTLPALAGIICKSCMKENREMVVVRLFLLLIRCQRQRPTRKQ